MGFDIGGGGNAFPFDKIGDTVTGKIISLEEVQQTDMDTGALAFWNDNPSQPKMMYRVTLQTELRDDPSDDGKRAVYLRGSRKPDSQSSLAAVLNAVKQATGGSSLDPGATLSLRFVGEGESNKRGYNPPKLYDARYVPAAMNLGDQGGQQQGYQQPQQQGFQQAAPQQQGFQPAPQQGFGQPQSQPSAQQPQQGFQPQQGGFQQQPAGAEPPF